MPCQHLSVGADGHRVRRQHHATERLVDRTGGRRVPGEHNDAHRDPDSGLEGNPVITGSLLPPPSRGARSPGPTDRSAVIARRPTGKTAGHEHARVDGRVDHKRGRSRRDSCGPPDRVVGTLRCTIDADALVELDACVRGRVATLTLCRQPRLHHHRLMLHTARNHYGYSRAQPAAAGMTAAGMAGMGTAGAGTDPRPSRPSRRSPAPRTSIRTSQDAGQQQRHRRAASHATRERRKDRAEGIHRPRRHELGSGQVIL